MPARSHRIDRRVFEAALTERGLLAKDAAKRARISESHLSRVVGGEKGLSAPKAAALAKVLGVSLVDLLAKAGADEVGAA